MYLSIYIYIYRFTDSKNVIRDKLPHGEIHRESERILGKVCDIFRGNIYRNGFLYKKLRINAVELDANPLQSEIDAFKQRLPADQFPEDEEHADDGLSKASF